MTMTTVPYKKIEWPKAPPRGHRKYSGQVELPPDGRSLIGHVAGLPFPNIDSPDPQIALKLMWNYDYKPWHTDDRTEHFYDADTSRMSGSCPTQIERHYLIEVGGFRLFASPARAKARLMVT
jgi:hypothetical protein